MNAPGNIAARPCRASRYCTVSPAATPGNTSVRAWAAVNCGADALVRTAWVITAPGPTGSAPPPAFSVAASSTRTSSRSVDQEKLCCATACAIAVVSARVDQVSTASAVPSILTVIAISTALCHTGTSAASAARAGRAPNASANTASAGAASAEAAKGGNDRGVEAMLQLLRHETVASVTRHSVIRITKS